MKICPRCRLANEERFPACLWCNTLLMDVRSTPSNDPNSPEHRQRAQSAQRQHGTQRQLASVLVGYVLMVVGLAALAGFVFDPRTLSIYAATGLATGLLLAADWLPAFPAALLQGALSLVVLLNFGPVQPFAFFMLLGHVLLPLVFAHALEMIHDANR